MAIISKIRKRSGLLIALIGVAIGGFVLQDAFFGRNSGNKAPFLAEINGQKISYAEFDQRVEDLTNQYKRAQGEDIALSPEDVSQIRTMAWERLLSEVLLNNACKDLGLQVSSKEMNDMYYGQFIAPILYNYFTNQQTGQYDRQQVMALINNFDQLSPEDQKTLGELEKVVKSERLKEKYYFMVSKAFYIPQLLAQQNAHFQSDLASAEFVCLDYANVADNEVEISEADYKKYYEENKHLFEQKTSRTIDYVVFDVLPTAEDYLEIEKNTQELYTELQNETNLADFVNTVSTLRFDSTYLSKKQMYPVWDTLLFNAVPGSFFEPRTIGNSIQMAKLMDVQMRPDSVKISHILLSYDEINRASTRTKEAASKLADSLLNILKAERAKFKELALAFSDDPSAQQNGGDLDWQREGAFVKPVNDAALKNAIGSFQVVESSFGFHVMEVNARTNPVKKVLAAIVSYPIEPSSKTTKAIHTKANRFVVETRNAEQFDSAVKKQGLQKRTSGQVDELASALPGLSYAREIVRWAYNKDTRKGEVAKEIFEYENKYVIACLKEITKEGSMSLEELKKLAQVEYMVKRDKKAEILSKKIKESGTSDLNTLATKFNCPVDTAAELTFMAYALGNKGFEPEIIGHIFGMKPNKVSQPIKGNQGVYVVKMNQLTPGNEALASYFKMQLDNMFQQSLGQSVRTTLEKSADIEDNRSFYF